MPLRPRSGVRVIALLCAVLGVLSGSVVLASAQQSGPGQRRAADTRLVVARLTGIVGPGSVAEGGVAPEHVLIRVLVEHQGTEDLQDVDVVIESFGRLTTRSLLRQALDDQIVGVPRRVVSEPVREDGPVLPGDIAAVDAFLDVEQLSEGGASGVYPLQISLRRGSELLDRVVTAVVHLAERPTNPMATVAVWPVDAAPQQISSSVEGEFAASIAPGGRLDDLVAALEGAQDSSLVAAVSTHLLEALAADAAPADDPDDAEPSDAQALLQRLRAVLARMPNPPVSGPYAEADLSALVEAGSVLTDMGGELAVDGPRRFEAIAGRASDASAVLTTAPVTARSLDLLPRGHLLLPWAAVAEELPGPDTAVPSPLRELRATSGAVLTATIADPWLANAMASPSLAHGGAVAVQRILAESALAHFEAPGVVDRPLLLLPPRDWDPSGLVARDLAVALTSAPWLRLVAPAEHAALVDDPPLAVLAVRADRIQASLIDRVRDTLGHLEGIRASLPEGVDRLGPRSTADLELQLRRATSHWFVDEPGRAAAMVADVEDAIEVAYGEVEIPTATGFTLLGEQQEIPITIHRTAGDDLLVDVEVRSGGALAWPSGDTQRRRLVAGERQTLSFDVQARARGDVRVDVIVRDASGARVLAEATIRVRSTFISRPALAIVAGVIVLLLLIGRRRRRPRAGHDDGPDEPARGEPPLAVIGTGDQGPRGTA